MECVVQSIILSYAKIVIIFCLMALFNSTQAQKQVHLKILEVNDNGAKSFISKTKVDSLKVGTIVRDNLLKLQSAGFFQAYCDTIVCLHDSCYAEVYKGNKYTIGSLQITDEQKSILEASGLKRLKLDDKMVDTTLLYSFLKSLISHEVNNGHPFAIAKFDSVKFVGNKLYTSLMLEKGRKVLFDSIVMEGRLRINSRYMRRLLDIYEGDLYSQDKISRINKRIADLPFVQQRSAPFVRFINDKASVIISPDPKPASRFDFLIGVLPQVVNGVRKWNITGDFTAELNNILDQGEYTFFQFKRLKTENLELLVKSNIPYLGGLPFGSHIDFRLFKNGNKNIDLFFDGGTQYLFGGFNHIKLYGSYRSSVLLEIDPEQIKNSGRLPQSLDVSYTGVGSGLNLRDLDYRFNPSSGYETQFNVVAGTKKILKNRQIEDLEGFENSYDTLTLKTLQLELDFAGAYYIPVRKWAAIKTGLTGALRYNQQTLRPNELLRIGGNKTLRGFDEESIFTDKYIFSTVEFRILFDQNSYFTIPFFDAGFVNTITEGRFKTDFVFGTGMGLNFGTQAGIFNLSFAAGKYGSNPLDFSKMKIHFGYVNLF
jgi:outer membrane protein assembly factor BamA